ncbi:MAG: hypothetical protein Tsb0014_39710 [Pleurocapsa sp.]
MFKPTKSHLKLFLATLFTVVGIHSINISGFNDINHIFADLDIGNQVIARDINNSNFNLENNELIAKKSGGRSGGGSFKKSSPSRSKSSGSSRSKSSTINRSSGSRSPSYSNPTYSGGYRTYSRSSGGGFFGFLFGLFFIGLFALVPIFLIYKVITGLFNRDTSHATSNQINRERDNDRVTISKVQVALSPQAEGIQKQLSDLSLTVDTDTEEGLLKLMQESVLILLRHDNAWTHVLSSSESLHIDNAEAAFDKISFTERSKFSSETLSNVDGNIQTLENVNYNRDEIIAYVVVTLILGTADDRPLFEKINTEEKLKEILLKLASMRSDYLMKFELLWTPQTEDEYLTDEELLMEYSDIIPL